MKNEIKYFRKLPNGNIIEYPDRETWYKESEENMEKMIEAVVSGKIGFIEGYLAATSYYQEKHTYEIKS